MIKFLFLFIAICGYGGEKFCYFTSPKKWEITDPRQLTSHVKIGFIGKGKKSFHPSLNLAIETVTVSAEDYVKKVKAIHELKPHQRWRDLGKFQTASGEGRLTEIESTTEWGQIRLLQLLLVKEGCAYILTGCAAKDEFGDYYQPFQTAFRSLTLLDHPLDGLPDSPKKTALMDKIKLKDWDSIQTMVINDFEMSTPWQILTLKFLQNKTSCAP